RVEQAENLYQVFQIPVGADVKSVKRQYRQLAMEFHPDKFFRKEIGGYRQKIEMAWKRVQEGYELLTNPDKKEAYDKEVLARQKARPAPPPPAQSAPPPNPNGSGAPAKFAPPPPPPSKAPAGQSTAAPEIPPWEAKSSPAKPPEPPRPRVASTAERKLFAEVQERIAKARRHFEQAKKEFAEKKWSNADTNIKLALQYDPKNEEYKTWFEGSRQAVEEGIVTGLLSKAEMAEASSDLKFAAESYEKALALFPDNAEVNLAYGKLVSFRGDNPRKAKECLQKGLLAHPNDLGGLLAMCKTMRTMGMAKNAQRYIDKAKEIAPKDPRVLEELKELKKAK
ncbi:MAG TPA: DnaJ domain-containing protein, partial [bacterium]|nr:DnaJ domain-containing protein [bacterium]